MRAINDPLAVAATNILLMSTANMLHEIAKGTTATDNPKTIAEYYAEAADALTCIAGTLKAISMRDDAMLDRLTDIGVAQFNAVVEKMRGSQQ